VRALGRRVHAGVCVRACVRRQQPHCREVGTRDSEVACSSDTAHRLRTHGTTPPAVASAEPERRATCSTHAIANRRRRAGAPASALMLQHCPHPIRPERAWRAGWRTRHSQRWGKGGGGAAAATGGYCCASTACTARKVRAESARIAPGVAAPGPASHPIQAGPCMSQRRRRKQAGERVYAGAAERAWRACWRARQAHKEVGCVCVRGA
jgi:hypothetical protein